MARGRLLPYAILAVAYAIAIPTVAGGAAVDGTHDPDEGPSLSIQTTQTNASDSRGGLLAFGSELDEAFGEISGGRLHVFFTGNWQAYMSEPLALPAHLQIFIDSGPGGQGVLRADNPAVGFSLGLVGLAGLRFDSDFAPDYWFAGALSVSQPPAFRAYAATLPENGGGTGALLGQSDGTAPGILTGGTNPYGVLAACNPSNDAGVTAGCGAASGAGVITGMEWSIPLEAIGSPTGLVRVCAFIAFEYGVSNQVLGPMPPGTCAFQSPSAVDFSTVPGDQYFFIDAPTPAREPSWGRLKATYRTGRGHRVTN